MPHGATAKGRSTAAGLQTRAPKPSKRTSGLGSGLVPESWAPNLDATSRLEWSSRHPFHQESLRRMNPGTRKFSGGRHEFIPPPHNGSVIKVTHRDQAGWIGIAPNGDVRPSYSHTTLPSNVRDDGIDTATASSATADEAFRFICAQLVTAQSKDDSRSVNPEERRPVGRHVLRRFLEGLPPYSPVHGGGRGEAHSCAPGRGSISAPAGKRIPLRAGERPGEFIVFRAGEPGVWVVQPGISVVHLRECGGSSAAFVKGGVVSGSSPRLRGRVPREPSVRALAGLSPRVRGNRVASAGGFTSACWTAGCAG